MASGCIMSEECPICGHIIWEDEWEITEKGELVHEGCLIVYNAKNMLDANKRIERLEKELEIFEDMTKRAIQGFRDEIEMLR